MTTYNHRLVPSHTTAILLPIEKVGGYFYRSDDTIPITSEWTAEELKILAEITPDGWNEIVYSWMRCGDVLVTTSPPIILKPFSQYLKALISLAGEGK